MTLNSKYWGLRQSMRVSQWRRRRQMVNRGSVSNLTQNEGPRRKEPSNRFKHREFASLYLVLSLDTK